MTVACTTCTLLELYSAQLEAFRSLSRGDVVVSKLKLDAQPNNVPDNASSRTTTRLFQIPNFNESTSLRSSLSKQQVFQRSLARTFSTSRCLQKKGGKAAREEKRAADGGKGAQGEDPYDFADLEGDIAQAIERLKNDLSKLRAGGRFNPEVVENLRVQPDKGSNQMVRLSDVAQVIPKGRQVQIMVGEKDVRAVTLFFSWPCKLTAHSTSNPSPRPSNLRRCLSRLNPTPQATIHFC